MAYLWEINESFAFPLSLWVLFSCSWVWLKVLGVWLNGARTYMSFLNFVFCKQKWSWDMFLEIWGKSCLCFRFHFVFCFETFAGMFCCGPWSGIEVNLNYWHIWCVILLILNFNKFIFYYRLWCYNYMLCLVTFHFILFLLWFLSLTFGWLI